MNNSPTTLILFILFFSLCSLTVYGQDQDSIPLTTNVDTVVIDTAVVDTVVIRTIQRRIRFVPRSVNLTNPRISFNKTRALDKKPNNFRIPSFWTKINNVGANFSEVAFVNWNAGGNNSVSALANAKFERNYKFRYIQWDNYMEMRYGLNVQDEQKLRKTDDALKFSSTFGLQRDTISNWYYSAKATFNTQFSNGYTYPDRSTPISRFMAPGYSFIGAGTSYITKDQKFNLYISPITQKATFVLDEQLANKGSFGVEKAVYDADGNIIKEGEKVFLEFGFLITNVYQKEVYKNMLLKSSLNLYTDYLRKFGNIDVNWELNLDLKVNKYIVTTIGTHLIYDDDIVFGEQTDANGTVVDAGSPKLQFKQLLGVGVSYAF